MHRLYRYLYVYMCHSPLSLLNRRPKPHTNSNVKGIFVCVYVCAYVHALCICTCIVHMWCWQCCFVFCRRRLYNINNLVQQIEEAGAKLLQNKSYTKISSLQLRRPKPHSRDTNRSLPLSLLRSVDNSKMKMFRPLPPLQP